MRKIKLITNSMDRTGHYLLKNQSKWISSAQLAKAVKCAGRTSRMYLDFFVDAKIVKSKFEWPRLMFKLRNKRKLNKFLSSKPRINR